MNRREYIIIAETIREQRENEYESTRVGGYTEDDIRPALLTIADFEDRICDRLRSEYGNFNESMFREACKATNQ